MVREPIEVRSHRIDRCKCRIRGGRHRRLDAVVLALVLSKQSPLLLQLLLMVLVALPLLVVATFIRHVRRRVRADLGPIRVVAEGCGSGRSSSQGPVQSTQS